MIQELALPRYDLLPVAIEVGSARRFAPLLRKS